ncbi:fimbrial protein [Ignatzschineria larvae]|uniref:fimbrial protein n=1 Tax=Ignatzschineria larvae TaxID=112009 RepID=UPI00146F95B2|nr:hypothetical protein [Ignatzschineria larvae]
MFTIAQAEEAKTPAGNASGQIIFEGTVTEAGCTLLPVKNVQLGSMSVAALKKGNGSWGESKIEFIDCNLDLPESAQKVETIALTIVGGTAATTESYWASLGTAADVAVEIKVAGNTVEPKGTEAKPIEGTVNATSNTVTFPVQGRMVKDGEGVTAGTVRTTVNFVANYK